MTNSKFLSCVKNKTASKPIWFFRQAGRYLPEYRALRKQEPNFLKFCYNPEFCIEAVLQPIRRYNLDAAIVFSDILVIPDALGQKVWFEGGVGPRLQPLNKNTLTDGLKIDQISNHLTPVYEAIDGMVSALNQTPLIGFSGSPWTLACYMIEGRGSRDFFSARQSALSDPTFPALIYLLEECIIRHLSNQIEAGVQAVQLFDSWAGILSPKLFELWVTNPTKRIVSALKKAYPDITVMGYARGAGHNNDNFAKETNIDVLTIDETINLGKIQNYNNLVLQGNLDPAYLLGSDEFLEQEIERWKQETKDLAWIYNLGHGIHKDTDPDKVALFVKNIRKP